MPNQLSNHCFRNICIMIINIIRVFYVAQYCTIVNYKRNIGLSCQECYSVFC